MTASQVNLQTISGGVAVETGFETDQNAGLERPVQVPVRYLFDSKQTPAVSVPAYSANDAVGPLLTFPLSRINGERVIVTGIGAVMKPAVAPDLLLIFFDSNPTASTFTDNAAYNIGAADIHKICAIAQLATGSWVTVGTSRVYNVNVNIILTPAAGTKNIYLGIVAGGAFTLTSTSDFLIRLRGNAG